MNYQQYPLSYDLLEMESFFYRNDYSGFTQNWVSSSKKHQSNIVMDQTFEQKEKNIAIQFIFDSAIQIGQYQPSSSQINVFFANQNEQNNIAKIKNKQKTPHYISICSDIFIQSSSNQYNQSLNFETKWSPLQTSIQSKEFVKCKTINKDQNIQQSNSPQKHKQKSLKKEKEPTYQGFLPTTKQMFITIINLHYPQLTDNPTYQQFISKGKIAIMKDFQTLFDDEELRQAFAKMFKSKYMRSQFNNTRIKQKNKKEFLKRMEYLKKCFIQRKVHNLI